MRVETFFIPFMGPSTNKIYKGCHWAERRKHAQDGHKACYTVQSHAFKQAVTITFRPVVGKGDTVRDTSNYSYTAKMIEDGLVRIGLLKDDSTKWVKRIILEEPIINRNMQSGMWVRIEYHKRNYCEACYRLTGNPWEKACGDCV